MKPVAPVTRMRPASPRIMARNPGGPTRARALPEAGPRGRASGSHSAGCRAGACAAGAATR
jgi:hypothetical protein